MQTSEHDFQELLEQHPITHRYRLAGGSTAEFPFYAHDITQRVISGHVAEAALRQVLENENVVPIGQLQGGRAPVNLWFNQCHQTCCGPYNEAIVAIPVFRQTHSGSPPRWLESMSCLEAASQENVSVYMVKLYLDNQQAIDIGREVWALPKVLKPCEVNLPLKQSVDAAFEVYDEDHRPVMFGKFANIPNVNPIPSRGTVEMVSPTAMGQKTVDLHTLGDVSVRPWHQDDRLELDEKEPTARMLRKMEFEPAWVAACERLMIIGTIPTNWRRI